MSLSLESRALVVASLAAGLALGCVSLTALAIQKNFSTETDAAAIDIETSPELISQGSRYFAMSCSHCHADDATGDEGPSLHHLGISNSRIATTIRKGVKGEMPSFSKKYDDKQIAALVSYLRSLH